MLPPGTAEPPLHVVGAFAHAASPSPAPSPESDAPHPLSAATSAAAAAPSHVLHETRIVRSPPSR